MTISVKLFIPAGKRARVTVGDTTSTYEASENDVYVGAVHGDVEITIAEEDAVATTNGGGNGGGPPPKD